jgi:hypothetical protein
MNRDEIKVTRQDATRQQIELAIDLLMRSKSLICANLLAWAAIDVLRAIADASGGNTFTASLDKHIKPEKLKQWYGFLKANYNFAKHADRDPDRSIELKSGAVEMAIFQAILDYREVYKNPTVPMLFYQGYMLGTNPELYREPNDVLIQQVKNYLGDDITLESSSILYIAMMENLDETISSLPKEIQSLVK